MRFSKSIPDYIKISNSILVIRDHCVQKQINTYKFMFLPWMEDSRAGNLTPGLKKCVESEFQVKNDQFQRPEAKNKENQL